MPLLAIYVTMATVGMAAYAYDELVLRRGEPGADYTIRRVERPAPDIVDLTLAPTGSDALPLTGGQFVYLRVGGSRAWREHCFSVAGVQPDDSVRLTIRALGHDTHRLHTDVREGLPATLNGPYGTFDHTLGGSARSPTTTPAWSPPSARSCPEPPGKGAEFTSCATSSA
ncbi:hypothetical protein [Streptomyces sioyaensis]|uniref:hypothetical protein n=1 Tax=Streptomyces sioyaensis TaxID=67364 RepID=UPI00378D1C1A